MDEYELLIEDTSNIELNSVETAKEQLKTRINALLAEGWELHGLTTVTEQKEYIILAQAMTKHTAPKVKAPRIVPGTIRKAR